MGKGLEDAEQIGRDSLKMWILRQIDSANSEMESVKILTDYMNFHIWDIEGSEFERKILRENGWDKYHNGNGKPGMMIGFNGKIIIGIDYLSGMDRKNAEDMVKKKLASVGLAEGYTEGFAGMSSHFSGFMARIWLNEPTEHLYSVTDLKVHALNDSLEIVKEFDDWYTQLMKEYNGHTEKAKRYAGSILSKYSE